MTQAIINNLNNLQDLSKKFANTGIDKGINFARIFDLKNASEPHSVKNVDTETLTLGDLKESLKDIKTSKELIEFKEILKQATDEANEESALDLTLARDITEIISELKESIETQSVEIKEQSSESEDLVSVAQNEDETNFNEDAEPKLEVMFEQVLASLDKTDLTKEQAFQTKGNLIIEDAKTTLEAAADTEVLSNELNILEEVSEFISKAITDETTEQKSLSNDIESVLDDEILKDLNIESIKAEVDTNTSEGDSLMQNQTPEECGVKTALNLNSEVFELKVENVEMKNNQAQPTAKPVVMSSEKIIEQITKQLEGLYNSSKVNIVLNPESLGKVNVQLISTKSGIVAQFLVETPEARDLLMKGLDGLKDTLGAHGIGVDNVSVKLSDTQKGEYRQDWTEQEGSRGGNKEQGRQDKNEKEKGLFEKMMAQTNNDENGNV